METNDFLQLGGERNAICKEPMQPINTGKLSSSKWGMALEPFIEIKQGE
jgi:hypothetical protein